MLYPDADPLHRFYILYIISVQCTTLAFKNVMISPRKITLSVGVGKIFVFT